MRTGSPAPNFHQPDTFPFNMHLNGILRKPRWGVGTCTSSEEAYASLMLKLSIKYLPDPLFLKNMIIAWNFFCPFSPKQHPTAAIMLGILQGCGTSRRAGRVRGIRLHAGMRCYEVNMGRVRFTFLIRTLRRSEAFRTKGDFLDKVELSLSLRLI